MFWDMVEILSSGFCPSPEIEFQVPTIMEVMITIGSLSLICLDAISLRRFTAMNHSLYGPYYLMILWRYIGTVLTDIPIMYV